MMNLGAAHNGDHLAECPLLDEVVAPLYSQSDAHRALRPIDPIDPIDLAHDLSLDLPALVRKVNQDHIAELQSLNLHVDRHQAMLRVASSLADFAGFPLCPSVRSSSDAVSFRFMDGVFLVQRARQDPRVAKAGPFDCRPRRVRPATRSTSD